MSSSSFFIKQKTSLHFPLSVVDFPPIKSKFHILSLSCCVWVKGSKRLTSSSRVILHTMSWYVNYSFEIWLTLLEISMKFMKISRWLSLSEWIETSCWHQSWWTNNVVFLYPGLPAARGQCHGSLEIFLYPSSFLVVFRITNQRNNSIEKLETLLFALIYNSVISMMKKKVCFTATSDFQFESRLS